MRKLNANQKRSILRHVEQHPEWPQFVILEELLTETEYWRIYTMNPHENFDANADRYASDLIAKRMFG